MYLQYSEARARMNTTKRGVPPFHATAGDAGHGAYVLRINLRRSMR